MKRERGERVLWAVGWVMVLVLAVPFVRSGLPSGHDILAHTTRTKMMYEALREGQIPVRWVGWAFSGAGAPLFNYYQVGFFYLAALAGMVVGKLSTAIEVTVVLVWWLGAVGVYATFWRRGKWAGMAAMLAYALSPYLTSDALVRGSYPELAALGMVPWWWYGWDRLVATGKKGYGVVAAVAMGMVAISHLPTLVLAGVFLLGYSLVELSTINYQLSCIKKLVVSFVLGMAVAAFYWVPAVLELPLIKNELLSAGGYDFAPHFVKVWQWVWPSWNYGASGVGTEGEMSFFVGEWQLLVLVLGFVMLSGRWKGLKKWFGKEWSEDRDLMKWGIWVVVGAMFLMHEVSLSFWEGYRGLRFFLYPWRLGMLVVMAATLMTGVLVGGLKREKKVVAAGVVVVLSMMSLGRLKPQMQLSENLLGINEEWEHGEGRWVDVEELFLPTTAVAATGVAELVEWVEGSGEVMVESEKAHEVVMGVDSESGGRLVVNRYDFAGWEAEMDGSEVLVERDPRGMVVVEVPEGRHEVKLRFGETGVRWWANGLSVVAGLGLGWWFYASLRYGGD